MNRTENFDLGVIMLIETLGIQQKVYENLKKEREDYQIWWERGIKEIEELKLEIQKIKKEN